MSLVAFTFGSLGDIIALLQLADQVRRALCDTRGASAEYRDLITELDSVVYTITNVQRVLSIQGPRRLAQSVENALSHAIGLCLHVVAQMSERISTRRQASCGYGFVGMMVADVWQSIGWTLFKREEVLFFRKQLLGQVAAMNTLLTLAQSDQLDHIGGQVSRFHEEYLDESRRQYTLIQEIHRCVMNKPHAMGYTWEAAQNPDNMPIVFTDMLGHTVTLPWEFVETEELLHEFLLFYFRNRPCLELVQWDQYFVFEEDNQSLAIADWENSWSVQGQLRFLSMYQPGSRVNMHGIVKLQFYVEPYSPRRRRWLQEDEHHDSTDHNTVVDFSPPSCLRYMSSALFNSLGELHDVYSDAFCYLSLEAQNSCGIFARGQENLFPWFLRWLPPRSRIRGFKKDDMCQMDMGGGFRWLNQMPVEVSSSVEGNCK